MPKHIVPHYVDQNSNTTCLTDCSNCHIFPTPFRRIGESDSCLFTEVRLKSGEEQTLVGTGMIRIIFLISGSLRLEANGIAPRFITSKQCVCLSRDDAFKIMAQDNAHIVLLSLINRIEFCEQDIFDKEMPYDTVIPSDKAPMLAINPAIETLLTNMFQIPEMIACGRYHKMKITELFMMIKVLYTPTEHAYFFQALILPQDNFRVFVCNNFDKASSVTELAELAGMSLSVFKRRFSEHFNDSVYHWMMRQKALKIFSDIRDGENSSKVLMKRYEFKHYTQFSRFCKNYLQATPAQLIASIKEG